LSFGIRPPAQQRFREQLSTEWLEPVCAWRCRARGTPRRGTSPPPSGVLPGGPHFTRIGPFAGGASPGPQAQCDPVLQRLARPRSSRRSLAALAGPACEMAHVENAGFRNRPITVACMHAQFEVLLHSRRSLLVAFHALFAGSALKSLRTMGCVPSIARTIRKALGLRKARFSSLPRRGILPSAASGPSRSRVRAGRQGHPHPTQRMELLKPASEIGTAK
jgi:hypothetical protein